MAKNKEKQINFRIREDVKLDLEATAESRGLSVSSLIHSLIVKASKEEQESYPDRYAEIKKRILGEKELAENSKKELTARVEKVSSKRINRFYVGNEPPKASKRSDIDIDLTDEFEPLHSVSLPKEEYAEVNLDLTDEEQPAYSLPKKNETAKDVKKQGG